MNKEVEGTSINDRDALKRGLFSVSQMAALKAYSDASEQVSIISGRATAKTNLGDIFYATAFQTGVEQFLIWPLSKEHLPTSDFIKQRMFSISPKTIVEHMNVIHSAFASHLPEDYSIRKEYSDVRMLGYLLQDILLAMHSRSSLLTVSGLPRITMRQLTCLSQSLFYL
jgi:hypothetical protein